MANQNKVAKVLIFERIILLLVITIIPLHFVIVRYIKENFLWERVNYFQIVSICYAILLITLTILQNVFHKPYLAIIFGCHQLEHRSFSFFYRYLKICSRCSGILIGMLLTVFLSKSNINKHLFLLGIIPIVIDGFYQYYSKYESTNQRRLLTGILFGPAFLVIVSYYYFFIAKLSMEIVKFIL